MLTMLEASKLLRVHYNTIRNWIREGKIKACKIGGVIRIPKDEIEMKIRNTKEKEM